MPNRLLRLAAVLAFIPAISAGQELLRPLEDLKQQVEQQQIDLPGQESVRPLEDLRRQVEQQQIEIQKLQQSLLEQESRIQLMGGQAEGENRIPFDESAGRLRERLRDRELPEERIEFLENLAEVALRNVNGRIHIDHWAHPNSSPGVNLIETGDPNDDPATELLYRRIRIGAKGKVPPLNMSYRLEIEHSGQDGSQFRDAWIGWDELPLLQTVRMGNQKRPYGWDHLNSSNFMVFLERAFVVEGFNEDSRRFGLASYGASEDLAYNWQYGFFYLPPVQDAGSIIGDPLQAEGAWRFSNTWWYDEDSDGADYGSWGLAGTVAFPDGDAPNDGSVDNQARFRTRPEARTVNRWLDTGRIRGAHTYEILGAEAVFNWGPVQLAGEWMNLWLQRDAGSGNDLNLNGGYVYLSCFLTGEHLPWDREIGVLGRLRPHRNLVRTVEPCDKEPLGWGAWQVAVRFSRADFNSDDVLGGIGQNTTLALNWYWNPYSRLQFNYIFGSVDDRLTPLNNGGTMVVSGDYEITGVRCMIDF